MELKVIEVTKENYWDLKMLGIVEVLILFNKEIKVGQKVRIIYRHGKDKTKELYSYIAIAKINYGSSSTPKYLNLTIKESL